MPTLTQPTKLDENNLSDALLELLDIACIDFDTFWHYQLCERSRELTRSLCCSDTCDTVVIDGEEVYGFWDKQNSDGGFEVWHLCPVNELKVYCTEENTNLSGEDLDDFVSELNREIDGLEIVKGRDDSMSVTCQFLFENEYLTDAWSRAMETILSSHAA